MHIRDSCDNLIEIFASAIISSATSSAHGTYAYLVCLVTFVCLITSCVSRHNCVPFPRLCALIRCFLHMSPRQTALLFKRTLAI